LFNLYSLIKKLYQQKSKKIKIISDIEVINPFIASACYGLSDKKMNLLSKNIKRVFVNMMLVKQIN